MKVGLYVAWLIAAIMLALAVVRPPSINFASRTFNYSSAQASRYHGRSYHRQRNDFYTLLRWVCCVVFAFSGFAAFQMKRVAWTFIFAVLAVLFNPLAPFYLQRQTWQIIDWTSIVVILFAAIVFWQGKKAAASS